jgi:hypothetical protein
VRHRGRAHLAGAARRRLRQRGEAQALARRCNDYAAELAARWPKRFGAFATVPMGSIKGALDEIAYALDVLALTASRCSRATARISSAILASIPCWRC